MDLHAMNGGETAHVAMFEQYFRAHVGVTGKASTSVTSRRPQFFLVKLEV